MKKNKIASSLIEAMVVLAILSVGVVWIYSFFSKSRAFLDWVSSKIEAIEIAREGIEALENIRNTNWLRFWDNIENCWDTLNYNTNCVLNSNLNNKINNWTYILKNNSGLWTLHSVVDNNNFSKNLLTSWVWKNKTNWLYCQPIDNNCVKKWKDGKIIIWRYTRIININYSKDKIKVTVDVEWIDPSKSGTRKVSVVNLMTNYKK